MSDLQCAATLYVLGPQAPEPDGIPGDARVALVWAAPSRCAQGERLARRLASFARTDPGLDGPSPGDDPVGAPSPSGDDPYDAIADLHRGECVVVLPARAYPGRPPDSWLQVRIDGDGRVVTAL